MIDMSDAGGGAGWMSKALVAAALVGLTATGAYRWFAAPRPVDAAGCPADGPTQVDVLAIDTTDPLVAANPARVSSVLDDELRRLPSGALFVIAAIDADLASELKPAFMQCAPERVDEANLATPLNPLRRAHAAYEAAVRKGVDKAAERGPAKRSPLVEQIGKIVTDARIQLHLPKARTVTVVSDLLQASSSGSAYRGTLHLPAQPPHVLKGWHVRFVQTTNPRDLPLQTAAIRAEWRRWALAAGASSVSFEGSGFAVEQR